jgi:hypothetical protein
METPQISNQGPPALPEPPAALVTENQHPDERPETHSLVAEDFAKNISAPSDLAAELGGPSEFSNEQAPAIPALSWLGSANRVIAAALGRVSHSLELRYAHFAGLDEHRRAAIVSELVLTKDVKDLPALLRAAGISEESFLRHLRTTKPLEAYQKLREHNHIGEPALFSLLIAALERNDPNIELHCSAPPFIGDSSLNERFVARVINLRPDIALRYSRSLQSFLVFNKELLIERLITTQPLTALQSEDLVSLLNPQQLYLTALTLASSDPYKLLELYTKNSALTHLHISQREEIASKVEEALRTATQLGSSALDVYAAFDALSEESRFRAFAIDSDSSPQKTLADISRYQLTGYQLRNAFEILLSKGLSKELLESLAAFSSVPSEQKVALVNLLQHSHLKETYEEIEQLLDWAGPFHLEVLDLELMTPYWKRLLLHRMQLGIDSAPVLRDLVQRKIASHPHLVDRELAALSLENSPWKNEVALALAHKYPENAMRYLEILRVSDQSSVAALEEIFGERASEAAQRWIRESGRTPSETLARAIRLGRMRDKPWSVVDAILAIPEEQRGELQEVFTICARRNPTKTLREMDAWQLSSDSLRASIWEICAQKNMWVALECAHRHGLASSPPVQNIFAKAMSRDCVRAVALLPGLGISQPETIKGALRQAIRSNASEGITIVEQVPLEQRDRAELVCQALRRNPRIFGKDPALIIRLVSEDDLPGVIAAQCRGDVKRALKLELPRSAPKLSSQQIVTACALENYSRALTSAPHEHRTLLEGPELLEHLIINAVIKGRWNSALAAAKRTCARLHDDPAHTEHGLSPALRKLDAMLEALRETELTDPSERFNVELIKRLRSANCVPTDLIQMALDYFGEDDSDYLLSIAERGGSSIAENIYETLLDLYKHSADITPLDSQIIEAALSLGFRGLSPNLFTRIRPIFESSEIQGRNALRNYFRVASAILSGQEIESNLIEPSLFPSLVVAAYRPVGMTEAMVKDLLSGISDHSEHLRPFTFPATGYPMTLQKASSIEVRAGETLDEDALSEIRAIVEGSSEQLGARAVGPFLKQLLQGAFDQIDLARAWGLVRQLSKDVRVQEMSRQVLSDLEPGGSLSLRARGLTASKELLSVVAYDALLEIAKANLDSTEPQVALVMSPKLQGMVRRILRMAPDAPVSKPEILAALDNQIIKLFRNQERVIAKESRKFTQRLSETTDRYVMYVSKNKAAFFGRAGAGLCTHSDMWSWNSPTFLQMMMVDKIKSRIVGNVQLHLFWNNQGRPSVIARINPTTVFLSSVDKAALAHGIMSTVQRFADENNLQLYLPGQSPWHELTNRDAFAPFLMRYYGSQEQVRVQITGSHTVTSVYQVKKTSPIHF